MSGAISRQLYSGFEVYSFRRSNPRRIKPAHLSVLDETRVQVATNDAF